MGDSPLAGEDWDVLRTIGQIWVCASYWEDETIQRYNRLGLVSCDGERIRLTELGRDASTITAPE